MMRLRRGGAAPARVTHQGNLGPWLRLLVLGVLAAPLSLAPASPATAAGIGGPSTYTGSSCPDFFYVGAAGSGQLKQDDEEAAKLIKHFHGMGPEVDTMFVELQRRIARSGLEVRRVPISYEARGTEELLPNAAIVAGLASPTTFRASLKAWQRRIARYEKSIGEGVTNTLAALRSLAAGRCRDAKLILAGYSQGAMVMHQAELRLADSGETALLQRISGTLLLADGDRVRSSAAASFGGSDVQAIGVRPSAKFSNGRDVALPATTANICKPGDVVCDFIPTLPSVVRGGRLHGTYVKHKGEKVTAVDPAVKDAVGWIAEELSATYACKPKSNVSLIVDDSSSMTDTDPERIRAEAIRLLLTKPSVQAKTIGAVEFGTDATTLFAPAPVGSSQAAMLASLDLLQEDGSSSGAGSGTDYNLAFARSGLDSPAADARVFLTDGNHEEGPYEDAHAGGPPTYVIGLSVANAEYGALLQRIADETGGSYFSLADGPDGKEGQLERLQPAVNAIDALLSCKELLRDRNGTMKRAGQKSPAIKAGYEGHAALEVVTSWTDTSADIDVASVAATNKRGKIVADLKGKGARKRLSVTSTEGATYETTTIQPLKGASAVRIKLKAAALQRATGYNVQIRSVPSGTVEVPPAPPTPPPPSDPPRKVITVDNRVTDGMGMREDSTPARLTTQPWTFCSSRGCNINGTERSSGQTYDAAVCQTTGERTTNGNDHSSADDANPLRFESTRYYGVRLGDGTFGYVSEVWISAAGRGGLGLPAC